MDFDVLVDDIYEPDDKTVLSTRYSVKLSRLLWWELFSLVSKITKEKLH